MSVANFFHGITKRLSFNRCFILIILLAITLRFAFLDLKLFHHDEAIHAWFSYELVTKGAYVYDPMYHGPLLYYLTAGMFWLLGQSDLIARLLPALFGTLLIPLVYYIYRLGYLDEKQAIVAALFVAISPDLVFFSRFLRHDVFELFFTLLILVALLYYLNSGKLRFALLTGIGVAGGMALKEDMPIFLLIFLVFGLYLIASKKIVLPKTWKRDALIGILLAVAILAALYSSFGTHFEILETGWINAWNHWTAMSGQCRICGPWFFYILLFLLYEVPIFIFAIVGIIQYAGTGARLKNTIKIFSEPLSRFRKQPGPELSTRELVGASVRQLETHRDSAIFKDKRDDFFIFCLFWLILSLAAYAVIGEKVPWLIIHQLLPMIFVAVYMMTKKKMAVALLTCLFLIVMTWHVAFVPADVNEPIVQVQNSEDVRTIIKIIDAADIVMIVSKDYWPLPWYDRGHGWDKVKFYGEVLNTDEIYKQLPDMVITHDLESYPELTGYNKRTYKLSYWFSVIDNENRIPEYYFFRDGKMGSINLDIFTRIGTNADNVMMNGPESGGKTWNFTLSTGSGIQKGSPVSLVYPNPLSNLTRIMGIKGI